MENEFLNSVLELHKQKNWRDIICLNNSDDINAVKLLWVWPSEKNLNFIKNVVIEQGCNSITSVGCGCGLLEWILIQATGLNVVGYEINKEWWDSKYSNPQFIPLQYVDHPLNTMFTSSDSALMFCYFNNGHAFRDYVKNYTGKVIFIIGPGYGKGRHTDPAPFSANFEHEQWTLYDYQEVKNSKDFIAAYVKM